MEAHRADGGKGLGLVAHVPEIGVRQREPNRSPIAEDGLDFDETAGILVGQRLEQDGVEHAEDRGIRTDAQRERQDGDDRESRIAAEHARAVSRVLPGLLDDVSCADVTHAFLDAIGAAHLEQCRAPGLGSRQTAALCSSASRSTYARSSASSFPIGASAVEEVSDSCAKTSQRHAASRVRTR